MNRKIGNMFGKRGFMSNSTDIQNKKEFKLLYSNKINKTNETNKNKVITKPKGTNVIKARWANPTWELFHTLSCQINETYYNKNYEEVFNIISVICNNLPCPNCKYHASERLKRVSLHEINTKNKLILFFFNFHNEVSERIGNKIYDKNILETYKNKNMVSVYLKFNNVFYTSYYTGTDLTGWILNKLKDKVDGYFRKKWNDLFQ